MVFIGIDPGVSGGIAALDSDGSVISCIKMPETPQDIWIALTEMSKQYEGRACIEKVSATPQMGVSSAFAFGRGYGQLLMALAAAAIPFDYVLPSKWQSALGCSTGGGRMGQRVADKNRTKRRAQELFPQIKMTHALADALLIAEYGRRLETRLGF
jgi:hypothetical protein